MVSLVVSIMATLEIVLGRKKLLDGRNGPFGVEIDDKLNFTTHISNICIKASQRVGVLLRLRNLILCKAKLIIYKSSILPHLTYCHLVWHNCRSSDSRKIERIQERALRAVFNSIQNHTKTFWFVQSYLHY